jgi:hypothetical protein
MALNWDVSKVENYEEIMNDDNYVVTESIIFYTMFVGMPVISQTNYTEFFSRVHLQERLFGSTVYQVDENNNRVDFPITLDEVKSRIGLRTNADTFTKSKFLSKTFERFSSESLRSHQK